MNTRKNMAVAALSLAAAAAIMSRPATAAIAPESANGAANAVVAYGDLDLARPEGRDALQGRLRAAARVVCGAPEREEVRAVFARRDCYRQAIAQGMRKMDVALPLVASAG